MTLERTRRASGHPIRWSKRVEVQRYLRVLARLCRMTPAEIAARSLQLTRRALPATGSDGFSPNHEARRSAFAMQFRGPGRERLVRRFEKRFLFGPSFREALRAPIRREAFAATHVVQLADSLSAEGLEILGVRLRLVPGDIDWQADPR